MTTRESPRRPRRLVVIDGPNTIYRAFFAIPPLRAHDGTPTNAAYGLVNTLLKVIREEDPDYVAIAFDPRGGSFRNRLYDAYKAGRDAQPEDLSAQIPVIRELIDALRVPVLEIPDFEADDVIATLAATLPDDVELVIVSTDRDLMQLVSERVTVVDGIRDRRFGPAEVEERYGVPPDRVLDLRALVGDTSDNIPGVKGIGEKGAAKLIAQYGSLENLLAHAGEISGKRAREALESQAEQARLSKELSSLRRDVPLPVALEELARQEPERERLRALYTRLGFTRLLDTLAEAGRAEGPAPAGRAEGAAAAARAIEVRVERVADAAGLARLLEALREEPAVTVLAVSTAGSAVDAVPLGLAFAVDDERAAYVPLAREGASGLPPEDVLDALAGLLDAASGLGWWSAGAKQLQSLCAERGRELPAARFDVEIAGFLLDPAGQHHVSALAARMLGSEVPTWEDVAGRGAKAIAAEALPEETLAGWSGRRACAVRRLVPLLREQLEKDALLALFEEVEMPLTRVLSRMERAGVRVDEGRLAALAEEYETKLARIEGEIYRLAGERFLINSPKQLQAILFEKLKLPVVKKTKTGYSTAEDVLEQLASHHELPERILAWRRLAKLKSTYVDALPPLVSAASGRIHPVFHQTGAATGRLSSSHPNVQNIPIRSEEGIRIREAFVPAEGRLLVSADYSQIELRILAHCSGDPSLLDAFAKGEDVHRRTAAEVAGIAPDEVSGEQRARAKAVNFGIVYGSSAFGLANQLGIATGDAQQTIDAYFRRYEGVRRFIDETLERARQAGHVTTLFGRRRYLPDLGSRNRMLRQAAERMAVNSVIQGTAADLIKRAMVEVDRDVEEAGLGAWLILQVHDELVFEVPESEVEVLTALCRSRMEGVAELRVPLVVEVGAGRSWREAH